MGAARLRTRTSTCPLWAVRSGAAVIANVTHARTGIDAQRVHVAIARASADGSLGKELGAALSAYLNRTVRCSSGVTISDPGTLWAYERRSDGLRWCVSLQEGLGYALADAMIGGSGKSQPAPVERAQRLVERAVQKFFECAASVSGAPMSRSIGLTTGGDSRLEDLAASGLCAVGEEYWWALSVVDDAGKTRVAGPATDGQIEPAIRAAASVIEAFAREPFEIASIDAGDPEKREGDVEVATTGTPSFRVRVDAESGHALAAAALRTSFPSGSGLGPVVVSVVETILNAALDAFAEEYGSARPDIGGDERLVVISRGRVGAHEISMTWTASRG